MKSHLNALYGHPWQSRPLNRLPMADRRVDADSGWRSIGGLSRLIVFIYIPRVSAGIYTCEN